MEINEEERVVLADALSYKINDELEKVARMQSDLHGDCDGGRLSDESLAAISAAITAKTAGVEKLRTLYRRLSTTQTPQ